MSRARVRHGSLVVASGVLLALAAGPASTAAQEPKARPPTFRTGTDAVLLDIVVRDRRGRPVRDLRQDEIAVVEDGTPRPVTAFRLVEGAGPPAGPHAPGDPGSATIIQPDPLRRVTLVSLVFDRLSQNGRTLAGKAAHAFVSRELAPGQWVAVFTLDERLRMRQDFTRDREALVRAIDRATSAAASEDAPALPGASRERDGSLSAAGDLPRGGGQAPTAGGGSSEIGAAASGAAMNAVTRRIQTFTESAELQQRGQSTLYPLMALAKAEGELEGRKAILLFSEGFQVPVNLEEAFRATISEANRANVSFYAIDSRGLDTARDLAAAGAALDRAGRTSQMEMLKQGAGPVTLDEVMNSETGQSAMRTNTQGVLEELATSTGGFLIANANDLRKGLERVTTDLASYYELAYTPSTGPFDGRFRKVEVKVARKGVAVQARDGYFALPPSDAAPLLPFELPLLAAAAAAPSPHAFDYGVAAYAFHDTPRGRQFTLVAEVPLETLTFDEDAKARQYSLRFAIMALVKDASGTIVERFSHAYPLQGPLDRLAALKRGNILFKRQMWLEPGRYTLVSVASDQASNRTSVHEMPLEVPAATPGLELSALSIIKRVAPAGDQPDPVEDPFRTGPIRIVPSLDTPVSKAATPQISAYVVVYPQPGPPAPALAFEFVRDGQVVGRSVAALPPPDAEGRIAFVATFPSSGFSPGRYELRATATQGTGRASTSTSFVIRP